MEMPFISGGGEEGGGDGGWGKGSGSGWKQKASDGWNGDIVALSGQINICYTSL